MPRMARKKQENAIYHIMARSISEIQLFKSDEDKNMYMFFIKEYQKLFNFIVYAYCLMDNHIHLIIDCNGADISKIMHCINFKYARYYNTIHNRHGHLFQDRFKSKIVTDDRYLVALSVYIHNNPTDVQGYENNPENYYYSSLGIYLGLRRDELKIINKEFILSMLGKEEKESKKRYIGLVMNSNAAAAKEITTDEAEFSNEKCEYRSERKILVRNFKIEDVIQFVVDKFNVKKELLHLKYRKDIMPAKGILSVLLRNLCNVGCREICGILGNITSSSVSKLSSIGIELLSNDEKYQNVINDFIESCC